MARRAPGEDGRLHGAVKTLAKSLKVPHTDADTEHYVAMLKRHGQSDAESSAARKDFRKFIMHSGGGEKLQDAARKLYDKSSVGEKHAMERILAVAHRIHEDKALVALTSSPSSSRATAGTSPASAARHLSLQCQPSHLKMMPRLDVAAGSSGTAVFFTIDMEQAQEITSKAAPGPPDQADLSKTKLRVKVCRESSSFMAELGSFNSDEFPKMPPLLLLPHHDLC